MIDVLETAMAVVAGGDNDLGTLGLGREQLFGLDAIALDAFHFRRRAAVDDPAAGAAAIVVFPVRFHLDKRFTTLPDHMARHLVQATAPHGVAGVVEGHRGGISSGGS